MSLCLKNQQKLIPNGYVFVVEILRSKSKTIMLNKRLCSYVFLSKNKRKLFIING